MKDLYSNLSKTHGLLKVLRLLRLIKRLIPETVKILRAQDLRESTKLLKLRTLDSDNKI